MWSALLLGFLGSFHCIGMCGPIVLALPAHSNDRYQKISSSLLYNFGRVITYSIFGIIFGLLGMGIYLAGLQQWVSILTGILILLVVAFPYIVPKKIQEFSALKYPFFKKAFNQLFQSKSYGAYFILGILNGLLPCGFVYIALSMALLEGSVLNSMIFMFFFGIGTIPAMFGLSFASSFLNLNVRNKIKKSIPYISIIIGLLLIIRGMNLGIPYLSPEFNTTKQETKVDCCHK